MDPPVPYFSDNVQERELPPCDIEHLEELIVVLKTNHPVVRSKVIQDLVAQEGEYIKKLLEVFDLCELDGDNQVLYRIFDIFYTLVELCDRRIIELLLNDDNFLSVVGVFGYNPSLIQEIDFRTELEHCHGFKEVIPIHDQEIIKRVHLNYRIHVIKVNVLSHSLPDSSVILLDHIANENNYYILSYINDTESYWQSIKTLLHNIERQWDILRLLKELIHLVRITRPLEKIPQIRKEGCMAPPVFGTLINHLFDDGKILESFSTILGSSTIKRIELVLDILNVLVWYQGPERLRTFLASEGKCITPPTSENDRILWEPGSSLFTALLYVFEQYETTRIQVFTLLKEVFKVILPQDDKFLNVLYPNYIHWILQPLKYTSVDDEAVLFALQDSIMELLTFCTEAHGYRIKYLFGRQPIAFYVERMLRSRNKLFVIHAVKFIRACVARGEAFFSRFLIQNHLFTPLFEQLKLGQRNSCAVSSAILELLAFIEKSNLSALIEHIYTKFYDAYKNECPIVFNAIEMRYKETFGHTSQDSTVFVQNRTMVDQEEERYWEKDDAMVRYVPLHRPSVQSPGTKLVGYPIDDEPISPLKDGDVIDKLLPSPRSDEQGTDDDEEIVEEDDQDSDEDDFQLPVRVKVDEVDTGFLSHAQPIKRVKSPQVKSLFQTITWKHTGPATEKTVNQTQETEQSNPLKRPLTIEKQEESPESIVKKNKTLTSS